MGCAAPYRSIEANPQKRKDIVWQIERKLAEAAVRPVLFYPVGATCRQPWVKGLTIMTNSIYNEWRMEDVWLNKIGGADEARRGPSDRRYRR